MSSDESIEVPVLELFGLAGALRVGAGTAEEARARLVPGAPVGGRLQPAVDAFLAGHGLTARGLAGELHRLDAAVAEVAGSWLALDAGLLVRRGQVRTP
ncbi:hypothetical protein OF117_13910 [Geodermatophilus sp. YIM 151500]|uniref:hypothetical protein n=1 Tax=Geodermatophilus sp. YIM 151500 TaxID=2984531 RepID=UPI0021E3F2CD|nr:hypothetical protein [Geodermatophilus sp. YIM 151500]MCV2490458.1 hypothetical protein [Geodermatophilus sp. YIM 151500]